MVGNPAVINELNARLSEEFAAYQQYSAHYKAAGQAIRQKGYEENAIVNACIRVTADQIGVAHLEAYGVEPGGTIVLYPDEPLQQLLGKPVTFLEDCVGEGIANRVNNSEGEIFLCENVRFHPEE
jgi:hypothetical protein